MIKWLWKAVVIMGLATAMLLGGCSSKKTEENETIDKDEVVLVLNTTPREEKRELYVNPLTGEESEEELPARPLIFSYDNVGSAVPQSWTSKADIVYEFPVEGNQTRLQAIFYGEIPEYFGPIRSTRPYFVDLTREYKGIFVAHGWSPEAKNYLMSGVVPYINAMNSSCDFYRVSDKSAPHNSYIKWSEIEKEIESKGWWEEKQEIRPFTFLEEDAKNVGEAVTHIEADYSATKCEFTYDAEKNHYVRTLKGKEYIDKETGEFVTVNNVLVQKVTSSVLDAKGRLSINMCAGGEAMLFTNGVVVKGTWKRDDLDSRTIFTDTEGNEFAFSVGKTWVLVANQYCDITFESANADE